MTALQQEITKLANLIIIKPDFPIKGVLPKDYPAHFLKLCELQKELHTDMAKDPDAYGAKSANRLFDFFSCLSKSGTIQNNQLVVCAESFKKETKRTQSYNSSPLTKYELIISKLIGFGFSFLPFSGKPFGKDVTEFVVEYPSYPQMLETIKQFYDCWGVIKKETFELRDGKAFWNVNGFTVHMYNYMVVADMAKIPPEEIADLLAIYKGTKNADGTTKTMKDILSEERFAPLSDLDKQCIFAFDKWMNERGYDYGDENIGGGYGQDKYVIEYGKSGTKSRPIAARIMIKDDYTVYLRLTLTKIDKHMQYIENAPAHIQNIFNFEGGDCISCSTMCAPGKVYTIDGKKMSKCNHNVFFTSWGLGDILPDILELLARFYPQKKEK